ncbi:AAA family ATPase [Methanopyrus kandleri]|uniref:CO dehydrogenase maturation factor n=2 Tax=Methanopyrus kandleri TaxID=2320 RepID=Q8TXF3_METKA|nr:AAA family ATPase [Methanopyrus kandleri]AAM01935.1 CO dehydrogenase maturation factor [Methanopyrus kandleri AV19]HII70052.1 AAA family ATPase [Methanopyrus kandleri]
MIIAFTGKGGTGKTLLAALTVLELLDRHPDADLLVVDADPDANMPDVLGVEVDTTLGEVREHFKREIEGGELPPGFDKQAYMEYLVMTALQESDDYDLLVMGRSEGKGCYCAVNHWLRRVMRELLPNYDYVVMDCEAGLEHISRGIIEGVDTVLTVVDHSYKALRTAVRISRLIDELESDVGEMWVVANRVTEGEYAVIREKGEELGLRFAGFVRPDDEVVRLELHGRPLTELPPDAKVRRDMRAVLTRVGVLLSDG